ncbi:MAG: hypothetical protein PHC28_16835 [Flavobacterium sp.]|uniref:TorF family putative porin n=1 Tax=Flavobacterium sp. TaxID=239 RepID=UPI00263962DD|nr:TorF family putative porin [Flavobacterium sp.]MDD5152118.1 hypothetical protein [Flavobacterium sp.]
MKTNLITKTKLNMKKVVTILALMLTSTLTFAQDAPAAAAPATEEPASKLAIGVDVVYPYLWRGFKLNANKVAFQPYLSYAFTDKLTVGVWGTTNLSNDIKSYNEFDWYASYQVSPVVKLMLSDYYYDTPLARGSYFNYDETSTQAIDFSVLLDFSEKGVPIDFQWNTLIAGNDFKYDSNDKKSRNFSSYTEIGYSQSIESAGINLRFFAGAVISNVNAYYLTDGFKFTNVGLNVSKEIKFSESFSLPVFVKYTYNDNGNLNKNWDGTVKSVVSGGMTFTIK